MHHHQHDAQGNDRAALNAAHILNSSSTSTVNAWPSITGFPDGSSSVVVLDTSFASSQTSSNRTSLQVSSSEPRENLSSAQLWQQYQSANKRATGPPGPTFQHPPSTAFVPPPAPPAQGMLGGVNATGEPLNMSPGGTGVGAGLSYAPGVLPGAQNLAMSTPLVQMNGQMYYSPLFTTDAAQSSSNATVCYPSMAPIQLYLLLGSGVPAASSTAAMVAHQSTPVPPQLLPALAPGTVAAARPQVGGPAIAHSPARTQSRIAEPALAARPAVTTERERHQISMGALERTDGQMETTAAHCHPSQHPRQSKTPQSPSRVLSQQPSCPWGVPAPAPMSASALGQPDRGLPQATRSGPAEPDGTVTVSAPARQVRPVSRPAEAPRPRRAAGAQRGPPQTVRGCLGSPDLSIYTVSPGQPNNPNVPALALPMPDWGSIPSSPTAGSPSQGGAQLP